MSSPNVLFIITDQHRAADVGFMGNEVVRTPALDSIAARGTVFENAWVANPVCMPNRSTLMTGRMPSAHGVIFNDRSLDWGANTWVRSLRQQGYRTALLGKSHLQHGLSRNSMNPARAAAVAEDPWPEGWNTWEDDERFDVGADGSGRDDRADFPDDFYGFDHVELSIDHGARITGHHLHWALDKGARYEDLVVPMSAESPATRRSDHWWQIYQPPYAPEVHSTTFVTERTIAFIEEAASEDTPWVAWASYPDPHHPMTPPGEWFDRHDPADMVLPVSFNDPIEGAPAYLKRVQQVPPHKQRGWVGMSGHGGNEALVREYIAATYGAIEMIDDGVARLLNSLDRLGQLDNTIIVFTSDHGDMQGEHGFLMKGFMPYRGTLQVPLVIADPRRKANRTASLASSLDVPQTLLALIGPAPFDGMQGTSLVPLMDGAAASVRSHVLIEDDLPVASAKPSGIPAKSRTLIDENGRKYTRHSSGEDMLFDLAADPHELSDLSGVDSTGRTQMVERLADALIQSADDARGAPVA